MNEISCKNNSLYQASVISNPLNEADPVEEGIEPKLDEASGGFSLKPRGKPKAILAKKGAPHFTLGKIEEAKDYIKQANLLEAGANAERREAEMELRLLRVLAALAGAAAVAAGVPKIELYKQLNLAPKTGVKYLKLADFYQDFSRKDLELREGNLLSLNQAETLLEVLDKVEISEDKARILKSVRDDADLLAETYGPEEIKKVNGGLGGDDESLRAWLDRNGAPPAAPTIDPARYEAKIEEEGIKVSCPSYLLFHAALTNGSRDSLKVLEWFNQPGGCHYEIRRVS